MSISVSGTRIRIEIGRERGPVLLGSRVSDFREYWSDLRLPEGLGLVVLDAAVPAEEALNIIGAMSRVRIVELHAPRKTLDHLSLIWNSLSDTRASYVIAIGGGTLLDVAGFAAATYQRGVPRINIPTTLLAMVDATIGGKTAIDYAGVKNAVGAVSEPIASLCHLPFLDSVPCDIRGAGFAEMLKIAALYNRALFWELATGAHSIPPDISLMARAISEKGRITQSRQTGSLGLLYGHNVAHGLEAISDINHGLAVAIGICLEAALGRSVGVTPIETVDAVASAIKAAGLSIVTQAEIDMRDLAAAIAKYKLTCDGRTRFVLPSEVGERYGGPAGYKSVEVAALPMLLGDASRILRPFAS